MSDSFLFLNRQNANDELQKSKELENGKHMFSQTQSILHASYSQRSRFAVVKYALSSHIDSLIGCLYSLSGPFITVVKQCLGKTST